MDKKKDWINIILFLIIAILIIIIGIIGFNNVQNKWDEILISFGVAMLGGLFCGFFLFGSNNFINKDNESRLCKSIIKVDLNKDMGQKYWIDLIENIENDSSPLWFVGTRHLTWIDKRLAYKRPLLNKIHGRIDKFNNKKPQYGYEIFIILSNADAYSEWRKLITEIAESTYYYQTRPELIKLGLVDEKYIKYSIIANSKKMIVTPYTSEGKSDNSPTLDIRPDSELAQVYYEDLENFKTKINLNYWYYDKKQ